MRESYPPPPHPPLPHTPSSSQAKYFLISFIAGIALAFLPVVGRVTKVITVANQTTYTGMSWFLGASLVVNTSISPRPVCRPQCLTNSPPHPTHP